MVVTEFPDAPENNTIYLIPNSFGGYDEYVFIGNEWTPIGYTDIPTYSTLAAFDLPKESPTNCKNCGAPLHNGKCNYCGSEY